MKHVHYDKIVAKAANMELVVFYKLPNEEWWQSESESTTLPDEDDTEYFLCLPQHKEAVLNCLNGGVSEVFGGSGNFDRCDAVIGSGWNSCSLLWYMNDACESRIKPKKEKRWIGHHEYGHTTTKTYTTKDDALSDTVDHDKWQLIEIEVEA